jgi:hypothetical protein
MFKSAVLLLKYGIYVPFYSVYMYYISIHCGTIYKIVEFWIGMKSKINWCYDFYGIELLFLLVTSFSFIYFDWYLMMAFI